MVGNTSPDLIVYPLTWATEAIHPVILGQLKKDFPRVKIFTQQWDYEEGPASGFFHSVERGRSPPRIISRSWTTMIAFAA